MPSFYIEFGEGATELAVSGDEFHHIVNVFRHKKGDVLSLTNGCGLKASGLIESIGKKELVLHLYSIQQVERKKPDVACAFSLLKEKKDLWIVEKLTELGVTDLFPFTSYYSVKSNQKNTLAKMQNTAIAAIKQCETAWLPTIHKPQSLPDCVKQVADTNKYHAIIASECRPPLTLYEYLHNNPDQSVCIFIGPEGGFHKQDLACMQGINVRLSDNVLRAETAAVSAVSVAMAITIKGKVE